jgi:hypothetical protein
MLLSVIVLVAFGPSFAGGQEIIEQPVEVVQVPTPIMPDTSSPMGALSVALEQPPHFLYDFAHPGVIEMGAPLLPNPLIQLGSPNGAFLSRPLLGSAD